MRVCAASRCMHAYCNTGARLGGCKFYRGIELCDTPGERWGHGAAMFDDNTMLIYGGYGHRY
jgi:hypothetical protein